MECLNVKIQWLCKAIVRAVRGHQSLDRSLLLMWLVLHYCRQQRVDTGRNTGSATSVWNGQLEMAPEQSDVQLIAQSTLCVVFYGPRPREAWTVPDGRSDGLVEL